MPKFITKKPRYVAQVGKGLEYVFASIEHPVVIELPDDAKPAPDLEPYNDGDDVKGEQLKPAFNPIGMRAPPSAAQVASQPVKDGKAKRAADKEPI